ncbi:activating transcription factor 7-interacting protein 1 [Polyodon spathula]|uniref:activating transcription factor 7-interacting protein 1 n=1 Tax=Polyodon spathula TaxID=7913 RepID=UPI001B7E1FCC|nr:activating transcription factor 7-interacting protein 1 [Polyodon spathula]
MDCLGEPQKKIFKARKTMRNSDRQQLESVHKARAELLKPGGGGGGEQGARERPDTPLLNGQHSPLENRASPPPPSPTPPSSPSPPPPSSTPQPPGPEQGGGVAAGPPRTEEEIYEDISEPSPAEAGPSEAGDSLTDTQTPGQTDGQLSVEMDTQPFAETDGQHSVETDTHSPGQTDGLPSVETDAQTDGQPPVETDAQSPGQTDRQQPSVEMDGEAPAETGGQSCTATNMEEEREEEEGADGGVGDPGEVEEGKERPRTLPDSTPACPPAEIEGSPPLLTPREESRGQTVSSMEIDLPSRAPPSPTPGTPPEEAPSSRPDSPHPPAQPGSPKPGEGPERSASPLKTSPEGPASPSETTSSRWERGITGPGRQGSSPSPAPSRHDSCDLIPREGFLVLSEEEEGGGERERVEDNEAAALAPPGGDPEGTAAGSWSDAERERGGEIQIEEDDPTKFWRGRISSVSSLPPVEVDTSPLLQPPSSLFLAQRKRLLSGGNAHSYPSPWEHKRPRRGVEGGDQLEAELELKITTGREGLQHKLKRIIQRILEEKVQALQCGEFDKTVKQLRERVERIECHTKHETLLTTLQAKISRLSKRFGAANKARDEEKKAQELSVVAAAAAPPTTTTYRSPQTVLLVRATSSKNATVNDVLTYASKNISVRKMLETKRTDIQSFKPLAMATTAPSPSAPGAVVTPLLQAAAPGTQLGSMGAVSLNLSQAPPLAAGNLATANQTTATTFSLPFIFHVPVAVSSSSSSSPAQTQLITAGAGRGQSAPPSSSSSSCSSSVAYSASTSSFELPPVPASSFPVAAPQSKLQPAVSPAKTFAPSPLGPTRATQGSLAQGGVANRPPPVATGLYGAPAGAGASAGARGGVQHGRSQAGALLVSQAGAESHSTIGSSSSTALGRAENQTINRAADSTTLKTPTQVVRSAIIDLTDDDDDVQVTGVRKAPPAVNQTPPSSLLGPLSSVPPPPPHPGHPPLQQGLACPAGAGDPATTTMHVAAHGQIETILELAETVRTLSFRLRPAGGPRTPLSSQGVFTPQLPSTPGGGNSRAVGAQQGQNRQGSPQSTGLPVRANPQTSPYALNGPQLTVHHRGLQRETLPTLPPHLHSSSSPPPLLLPPLHPAPGGRAPPAPPPERGLPEALAHDPLLREPTFTSRPASTECAAVDSYHLYAYHQDPSSSSSSSSPPSSQWKKIGEVKALPLPMACTLTQFVSGSKYYFAVRGKDIYGRFGAFCEPQSTDVIATQQPGS